MREDRAVLPHFLLFLRNAESSSANLRAFVDASPARKALRLYVALQLEVLLKFLVFPQNQQRHISVQHSFR